MPSCPSGDAMHIAARAASWSSAAGATAARAASRMLAMPVRLPEAMRSASRATSTGKLSGDSGGTDSRPICQARSASIALARQQEVHRGGLAHRQREPLGAAEAGHASDPCLGQSELAALGCDDEVTGEGQLEPASEGEPIDLGNDRDRATPRSPTSCGVLR